MTFKSKLIAVITAALLSACSSESSKTPTEVTELYWQAILAGNSKSASELVLEAVDLELSRSIQPGSDSAVNFGEVQITDGSATVATTLTWVDNDKEVVFSFPTSLTKRENAWKINANQTQEDFFRSVYEFSLTEQGIDLLPEPNDSDELTPQELNALVEELEQTTKELHRQRQQPTEEVEAFLERLDEDLKEKIAE